MPFDGNMEDIMAASQPIIEIALDLSGPISEKQETKAWIKQKIADGDYSYKECDEYPELMEAYVEKKIAQCIAQGDKNGFLVLKPGEEPVGSEVTYQLCSTRVGRRRATASDVVCRCS